MSQSKNTQEISESTSHFPLKPNLVFFTIFELKSALCMSNNRLKALGPGILFASTAIGVSHLVQSTQAGASFGLTMIWAIVLANLFKYPFFEYGSRYANATGKSIIDGYRKLGPIPLYLFFTILLISMFLVTAAVANVTAGFMQSLFNIKSTIGTVFVLFVTCLTILFKNNFKLLDRLIKIIGITLLISTLIAFALVLFKGPQGDLPLFNTSTIPRAEYFAFLIPLMGWMPTALDLSTWNSLWTIEKIKESGYHPPFSETKFDFNLGYIISALLAICFLVLGAFIMYGTGESLSNNSSQFSAQVIGLYTATFGQWAKLVMSIAAFSIMFGTCIAVFDGYSRAMSATIQAIKPEINTRFSSNLQYRILLIIIGLGSFFIIYYFQENPEGFLALVTLSTAVSFLFAPIIAIFNFILVQKKHVGLSHYPNAIMRTISYLGILFLTGFSVYYLFSFF